MRVRLGINTAFAVKRWPRPADWAAIVSSELGLDLVELSLDLMDEGFALLSRGPLSLREREIVIDRTCALTGCEYEWGVHVNAFAAAAGLTEAQIRATVLGQADAACWSAIFWATLLT